MSLWRMKLSRLVLARLGGLFSLCLFSFGVNAATDPIGHFRIEIATFSYPLLSPNEQKSVFSTLLKQLHVSATYLPSQLIEGKTKKTTKRFRLFGNLEGVGPIPSPHVETKVETKSKQVDLKVAASIDAQTAHWLLSFDLPLKQAELLELNSINVNSLSTDAFYKHASIQSMPLHREYGELFLFPFMLSQTPANNQFSMMNVQLPGAANEVGKSGIASIKASYTVDHSKQNLALKFGYPLSTDGLSAESKALVAQGEIPESVQLSQLPNYCIGCEPIIREIIIPTNLPRWHRMREYQSFGSQIEVETQGAYQYLSMKGAVAPTGNVRGYHRSETWASYQGKLINYSGMVEFEKLTDNDVSVPPALSWNTSRLNGKVFNPDIRFIPTSPKKMQVSEKDCAEVICQQVLRSMKKQLAKTDAALQEEMASYVRLVTSPKKVCLENEAESVYDLSGRYMQGIDLLGDDFKITATQADGKPLPAG
ncbi:hypothetical protein LIN78_15835 [Leeia sp. TBRC 13508]|uniref:Uncharacterized protein n=1 Tax=Leeia speluncae TaxID=2884804 RepID=A0ABS8D9X8_9NEIS|nr:hypothetical protein [Leeia speluncae]MCB6185018.1 hypothetical protein [Leeia speluncae]